MDNISNVELEYRLLSAILCNQNTIYNVNNLLNSKCFTDTQAKNIWDAIMDLHNNGKPADLGAIFSYMYDRDNSFTAQTLVHITEKYYTADITHVAQILYEKYMRRETVSTAMTLIEKCHDQKSDIFELLNSNKEQMIKILNPAVANMNTLDNVILENINYIHENLGKYCEVRGIPSGFEEFDKRTGGAGKGWFMVIGGRPAMGKTTFAINWAYNAYNLFNKNVLFFTGEMSKKEVSNLIMARESKISALDLKKNKIDYDELEMLRNKFKESKGNKLYIDDTPNPSITHILSESTKAKMQHDIDIIFVDHIHIVKAPGEKRNLEVAKISRELKGLARNLNIPVVALAQLNRGVEGRAIKSPQLSDLKESGDIEQDADVVTFLHRPEYYMDEKPDTMKDGTTHLITRKHRHGETGIDYLLMDKSTSTFNTYIQDQDTTISPDNYNKQLTQLVEFKKVEKHKFQVFDTESSFTDRMNQNHDELPF